MIKKKLFKFATIHENHTQILSCYCVSLSLDLPIILFPILWSSESCMRDIYDDDEMSCAYDLYYSKQLIIAFQSIIITITLQFCYCGYFFDWAQYVDWTLKTYLWAHNLLFFYILITKYSRPASYSLLLHTQYIVDIFFYCLFVKSE